jgi:hypothetical protein
LRERGWGSSNSDEGTFTVVLFINKYFVGTTLCALLPLSPSTVLATFEIAVVSKTKSFARYHGIKKIIWNGHGYRQSH